MNQKRIPIPNSLEHAITLFELNAKRHLHSPFVVTTTSTYLIIEYHKIKQHLAMDACYDATSALFQELHARFQVLETLYIKFNQPYTKEDIEHIEQEYTGMYRALLQLLHAYTAPTALDESTIMDMERTLILRDWLAILGPYVYHDRSSLLEYDTTNLETFLRIHVPHAFIATLGSITDTAYRCHRGVPDDYWWWFREGYQASDETSAN